MALMLAVMGLRPTADYTWSSQRFQPVHEELGAYQRGGEGSDAERIGKIKRHFCAASVGALPWSPQRHPLADPPRLGCVRAPSAGRQHPAEHTGARAGAALCDDPGAGHAPQDGVG